MIIDNKICGGKKNMEYKIEDLDGEEMLELLLYKVSNDEMKTLDEMREMIKSILMKVHDNKFKELSSQIPVFLCELKVK